MAVDVQRHRFTLEQYEHMVSAGVLGEDDRVELIDGEIIEMAPNDPPHVSPIRRLMTAFQPIRDRAVMLVQMPIRVPPRSEPEPDLALAIPPEERYARKHPEPGDLLLVVEVSHTTKRFDLTVKIPLYARSGISEVWIVDVPGEHIEVYRGPTPDGYDSVEVVARGGTVTPQAFPDVPVAVDEILPG
jgi:Uma2 family endonuclease